ncbi:MAG: DUF177 domain-containing protein [Bacteroidetes bacterium]|nr:MAG: DUF177 domain-containing protein [Bacteroidota bacterium]
MKVHIDDIPEAGRDLHYHWKEGKLRQFMPPDDPFEIEMVEPIEVNLRISKKTDHLRVQGELRACLRLSCHRCLGHFQQQLQPPIDTVLMHAPATPEDEEVELDAEELDTTFFDGEEIDIDHLVAEELFLALPFQVLCKEECKGLCPGCGANLNLEPCRCERGVSASPFASLQLLKGRLNQ